MASTALMWSLECCWTNMTPSKSFLLWPSFLISSTHLCQTVSSQVKGTLMNRVRWPFDKPRRCLSFIVYCLKLMRDNHLYAIRSMLHHFLLWKDVWIFISGNHIMMYGCIMAILKKVEHGNVGSNYFSINWWWINWTVWCQKCYGQKQMTIILRALSFRPKLC